MTELRRRMDEDMVLRGMADRTRETYLWAVAALARFYRRSPDQISDEEIQKYLLHLMRERHQAWSTCNIVVHALRFFYHTTLQRDRTTFCLPTSRQPSKLPALLSREEVQQLFAAASHPTHRVMFLTAYAAGLRLNELRLLRVSDIDSARMTIRVEQGKGSKDRYTVLSASAGLHHRQASGGDHQAGRHPCAAPRLCDAPARGGRRSAHDSAAPRPPIN